jgi:hypothetical protein
MDKPRLTAKVANGLVDVAALALADIETDPERDWENVPDALQYIVKLARWYKCKKGVRNG